MRRSQHGRCTNRNLAFLIVFFSLGGRGFSLPPNELGFDHEDSELPTDQL
jgi:hypothetical protein